MQLRRRLGELMSEMQELLATMPQTGTVKWMCIRPTARQDVQSVDSIEIDEEQSIIGDHFSGKPGSKRQVTLIQQEHIAAVANILGGEVLPEQLRRNIVVSGINLQALKDRRFKIGTAVLFGTGNCPPCSRMESNLGPGGYNAMRGHGGLTARVIQPGIVNLGDEVSLETE